MYITQEFIKWKTDYNWPKRINGYGSNGYYDFNMNEPYQWHKYTNYTEWITAPVHDHAKYYLSGHFTQ